MALASLIVGMAEFEDDGGGVRAAMPFLGRSLIEHQARQAAAAGAHHIVILVERVPAALVNAVDRLKREGIGVELARSVADAADRIHPEEQLLLIADGIIARQDLIARAAGAQAPSLFTLPESIDTTQFERIDAGARWAGLALIDGALLRKTVAMLGDWDLQSTLLRRIVQSEAMRVEVSPAGVILAESMEKVRKAESALLSADGIGGWVPAPVREGLSSFILAKGIKPFWMRCSALGLAALSVLLTAIGWTGSGALALALTGPLLAIPSQIDEIALRSAKWRGFWLKARDGLAIGAVIALGWRFSLEYGGWSIWPLAGSAIGVMIILSGTERLLGRAIAGPAAMALLAFPFAAFGLPHWSLGIVGIAGFVAVIAGQRLLARQVPGLGSI